MRSRWQTRAVEAAQIARASPREVRMSRQAMWDADHMRTASCRLTAREMDRLRAAVAADGITVYGLLRYMIRVYVSL